MKGLKMVQFGAVLVPDEGWNHEMQRAAEPQPNMERTDQPQRHEERKERDEKISSLRSSCLCGLRRKPREPKCPYAHIPPLSKSKPGDYSFGVKLKCGLVPCFQILVVLAIGPKSQTAVTSPHQKTNLCTATRDHVAVTH